MVSLQLKETLWSVTGSLAEWALAVGYENRSTAERNPRAVQHCDCRTGEANGRAGGIAEYKRDEKEGRVNWPKCCYSFLFEYSSPTVLCEFQVYSKVSHYAHMYIMLSEARQTNTNIL